MYVGISKKHTHKLKLPFYKNTNDSPNYYCIQQYHLCACLYATVIAIEYIHFYYAGYGCGEDVHITVI